MDNCKIPLVVVCFLGISALVLSVGLLFLTYVGQTPDGGLMTLAGTAIGSLATLLTNTQRGGQRASDGQAVVLPATEQGGAMTGTTAVAAVVTNKTEEEKADSQ